MKSFGVIEHVKRIFYIILIVSADIACHTHIKFKKKSVKYKY